MLVFTFLLDLGNLITFIRGIIEIFSKAKAAKLIRELVDLFLTMGAETEHEVSAGYRVSHVSACMRELYTCRDREKSPLTIYLFTVIAMATTLLTLSTLG